MKRLKQVAEKSAQHTTEPKAGLQFSVEGHGFSRAVKVAEHEGFSP